MEQKIKEAVERIVAIDEMTAHMSRHERTDLDKERHAICERITDEYGTPYYGLLHILTAQIARDNEFPDLDGRAFDLGNNYDYAELFDTLGITTFTISAQTSAIVEHIRVFMESGFSLTDVVKVNIHHKEEPYLFYALKFQK